MCNSEIMRVETHRYEMDVQIDRLSHAIRGQAAMDPVHIQGENINM